MQIYLIAFIYSINFAQLIELIEYPIAALVSFIIAMGWMTLTLIGFNQEKENLKKKKEELKSTTIELERFSYNASHDLKSPLRTIISFSDLIQKDLNHENFQLIDEKMNYIISGAKLELSKNILNRFLNFLGDYTIPQNTQV